MEEPVRIAHIVGKLNAAGVEAVVNNYYKNIDRSRFQFDYFIDADSTMAPPQELMELGARYIVIPPYQQLPKYMKTLVTLFRQNGYTIVHSGMNTLSVFPLLAARIAGVPVRINHNHSTANVKEGKRVVLKYMLRPFAPLFATDLAACGEKAGRWLFGDKRFDKGEVTVFRNAIDYERFRFDEAKRKEMRSRLGLDDCFVVGHVGRFMPQKNHAFLLEAFVLLAEKRPDARLLLVGDGELRADMELRCAELGIADRVIFTGTVSNTCDYYQAMDLFCLPSLFEGLPVVAVEAQVAELPVLVSDEVTQEVNISGQVEFLPLKSAGDWAEAMEKMTSRGRIPLPDGPEKDAFNIRTAAGELEEYYEELLARVK